MTLQVVECFAFVGLGLGVCVGRWGFPEDLYVENKKIINFESLSVMADLTVQCFDVLVDLSSKNDPKRL